MKGFAGEVPPPPPSPSSICRPAILITVVPGCSQPRLSRYWKGAHQSDKINGILWRKFGTSGLFGVGSECRPAKAKQKPRNIRDYA